MKKLSIIILIAAFLFPVLGHAATAPVKPATQTAEVDPIDVNSPSLEGKSLSVKKATVQAALADIYSQLTSLSAKTQEATNQLNGNGILTINAQNALIAANTSLAKAKTNVDTFGDIAISNTKSSATILDTMKAVATTAEFNLQDAKAHLLDSLTALKASVTNL